jgi:predicted transcriptional regulator
VFEILSLRSGNRSKISGLIHQNPGIHLRGLQRKLGVSFNSVRYNTEKLVHSGEVVCEKGVGYSRFFPPGMSEKDRLIYSISRNKTTFKILAELSDQAMLTNKDLTVRTGFAKSTVSEHVHLLLGANLVKLTLSEEGNFKVELQDREYVKCVVGAISLADLQNDVVQNYVDLWDF